jgi:DNA-binding MarR family transcriptional regulator
VRFCEKFGLVIILFSIYYLFQKSHELRILMIEVETDQKLAELQYDYQGITLNEYAIADSVYHLSNNPNSDFKGWCYASKETLGGFVGIDRATVFRIIDRLIEKGLVEKHPETAYLKTTDLWYNTVVLPKLDRRQSQNATVGDKTRLPQSQSATSNSRKTPPNNNRVVLENSNQWC